MKANEAPDFPEKVYIPRDSEYPQSPDIWWERESSESNIEYTRTDAFIEKAINFLEMLGYGFTITDNITHTNYDKEHLVEDFKNYMKGE